VLNGRIENNLVLERGQVVEGLLLATGIRPIPVQYSDCAGAPFRLTLWDQFGNEIGAQGTLSVLRIPQLGKVGVRRGTGLYGMDENGRPPALSIGEESRRRYLDLLTRDKRAEQQRRGKADGVDSRD
jgi:hypothetical protein